MELEQKIKELISNEVLNNSLAAPVLKEVLEQLTSLELNLKEALQQNKNKEVTIGILEDDLAAANSSLEERIKQVKKLTAREEEINEKEKQQIRNELEIEMLKKQVEFVQTENNNILRNAEIRKTLQSVMPVAVNGMQGLADNTGMVVHYPTEGRVEKHETTTTETKEES